MSQIFASYHRTVRHHAAQHSDRIVTIDVTSPDVQFTTVVQ